MSANLADAFLYISETEGGDRYPVTVVGWDDWRPLAKALHGEIPAGARWVTVHSHGPDEPGHPMLIMPVKNTLLYYMPLFISSQTLNMLEQKHPLNWLLIYELQMYRCLIVVNSEMMEEIIWTLF